MSESPTGNAFADLRETLHALPKIDLHRHLEGSLRIESLHEIAASQKLNVPARTLEELRPLVQITDRDRDFRDFLRKFDVLRRFYHSPETIQRLAYEVVADAAADNVRYLELRFTPMALAKVRQFPLPEVVDWVIDAVNRAAADHNVQVRLIASFNRHEPFEVGRRVTEIAVDRMARGICGLDLAGDEANFGTVQFGPLFREARAAGMGITIHAGEWNGPEVVRMAIERLSAVRIGHGVRVVEDAAVVELARERRITFEVCLTSNVQTGVIYWMADHPLPLMYRRGLATTINTDDPSISGITLTDEYYKAVAELGLKVEDIKRMILTAAGSAFLPPNEQAVLVARFQHWLADPSSAPKADGHSPQSADNKKTSEVPRSASEV